MKRIICICLTLCFLLCGCSLNSDTVDTSASKLFDDRMLNASSDRFDLDLAKIAAELSDQAESTSDTNIKKCYAKYGIKKTKTENYNTTILGGSAYCLGVKSIENNGETDIIIVVTARGSTTKTEFLGDQRWLAEISFWRKKDFNGYSVWDNVKEFEDTIWNSLYKYMESLKNGGYFTKNTRIKMLVTGHSLGGAAANLVGARLKSDILDNSAWSGLISKSDIHVYTFNAISVLTTAGNEESGYENIHNVYNKYDSYGPNGNQKDYNASSPYCKFGHTEMYERQDKEEGNSCNNHMNYRAALDNPEEYRLSTCAGKGAFQKSRSDDIESSESSLEASEQEEPPTNDEQYYSGNDEQYSSNTVPPGTYLSTDGYEQVFEFYEGNGISMNAFGFSADGTYKIEGGRIIVNYVIFGSETVWSPSFSMDGDTINIAGTDFIRVSE